MAHVGTLRDHRFSGDVDDIRGSVLYGRDNEKLGKIDDVIFDHGSGTVQYAVVDTGGWLSSRKFLVPGDRIEQRADSDDFVCNLSKSQVEQLPEYNDNVIRDEKDWDRYESNYRASWSTGPVLHKEGSPNIITPDPDEMPAATGRGEDLGVDFTPDRIAPVFTDTEPRGERIRMRPSGIASRAEDTSRPGRALNSERTEWEDSRDGSMEQRGEEDDISDVANRDFTAARDRDIVARDTGRNISNADLPGYPSGSAYGSADRTVVPDARTKNLPPSYRESSDNLQDTVDTHRPYPVQEGRNRRWTAFEEHLRRNRVDITADCPSCAHKRDDKAA